MPTGHTSDNQCNDRDRWSTLSVTYTDLTDQYIIGRCLLDYKHKLFLLNPFEHISSPSL